MFSRIRYNPGPAHAGLDRSSPRATTKPPPHEIAAIPHPPGLSGEQGMSVGRSDGRLDSVLQTADTDQNALPRAPRPPARPEGSKMPAKPVKSRREDRDYEDLVRLYLEDVGRHDLLTKDDEVRLAQAIEAGVAARTELETTKKLTPTQRRQLRRGVRL